MIPKPIQLRAAAGAAAALVLALASCESGTGPGTVRPGITIVAGASVSDTVGALAPDLVVEVRDSSGAPVQGTVVTFHPSHGLRGTTMELRTPSGEYRWPIAATTDRRGRASVRVQLGGEVGTGEVYVASHGFADTVRYTIRAGALAHVVPAPLDTAAYAGGGYRITAQATDRFGNALPDPVTFSAGSPSVATVAGDRVSAAAMGRGFVLATAGGVTDTAWISVVPRGTLAVRNHRTGRHPFVVLGLDGSAMREVLDADAVPGSFGRHNWSMGLEWTPSGDEIAFYDGAEIHLWATTLDGTVRPLLPPAVGGGIHATPRFSSDGEWMYFNVGYWLSDEGYVWRARPDGTGAERVTSEPRAWRTHDVNADPSPDGTRIVYMTTRESPDALDRYRLRVRDLATGAVRSLGVRGEMPRWAPNSEWIVFWRDYRIWLIRADGTGERALTPADVEYERGASWSPDGEWIVAARFRELPGLDVIRAETGEILPLAFTHRFTDPVWKP